MKMKRFFSNKNKKKKATVESQPSIYEQKHNNKKVIQDEFDSLDSKPLSRKQKRNQRKQLKKSKSKDVECAVVLVNSHHNIPNNAPIHYPENRVTRRSESGMRIPGSESSSRTASSASSSSSRLQRPWSWVEPSRAYTLGEFTREDELQGEFTHLENPRKVILPHNASHTLTRDHRSATEHSEFTKETRFRTSTMDFFRRLRKPTMSHSQKHSIDSNLGPPENDATFRKRDPTSKTKNSKTQKNSKNSLSRGSLSEQNSSSSLPLNFNSPSCNVSTVSELLNYSKDKNHERSHSTSTTSSGTVISNSTTPVRIPDRRNDQMLNNCNSCKLSQIACTCGEMHLSIVDTDPNLPSYNAINSINKRYSSPVCMSLHTLDDHLKGSYPDDSSVTSGSTIEDSYELGESTLKLQKIKNNVNQTLPRKMPQRETYPTSSLKRRAFFTSTPQLCDRTNPTRGLTSVNENPANLLQVPQSNNITRERSKTVVPSSHLQNESQLVDSPIKRAIAFPGVVLRRHKNKSEKKKNQSTEMLSRENRAFQTMSLNFDTPNHKLNSLAEFRKSQNLAALSDHINRLHSTSVGDLSDISRFQEIDPNLLLDDDELSNFYLAYQKKGTSSDSSKSFQNQDQGSKRVKNLRKSVASFANLISPGKPRGKLQRSSSFKESAAQPCKPYRAPGQNNSTVSSSSLGGSTPGRTSNSGKAKNRRSRLWCETFDRSGLNNKEVKRQEAIFELYQGECDLVQDLKMAKQTYRDSMVTLKMLSEDEVNTIFGKLDCLLPLHENLLKLLESERSSSGRTDTIGKVFIDWFPTLVGYEEYCANQSSAKEALDKVISREARVRDFLQRCLESPFSRKLDLWSYLDLPRSRLVKYPLLLKNILNATGNEHMDKNNIEQALGIINDIISRVDDVTGNQQASFVLDKLEFLDDKQRCLELEDCRSLVCSGQLKNNRGAKLQVFLFDLVIVLTRNATRGGKLVYQVYRQPLTLRSLSIDSEEGGKLGGSFRGGILSSDKAKHSFRIRCEILNISYTLIAADEHDRKQWLNSIEEAINKLQLVKDQISTSEQTSTLKSKSASIKRSLSAKSDSGHTSPWLRHRSNTSINLSQTANSEKKESTSRKFKLPSPLTRRKNSISLRKRLAATEAEATRDEWEDNSVDDSYQSRDKEDDERKVSPCRRSQSLNASPNISRLSVSIRSKFNGSNPKRESFLVRSKSCNKPPSGRVLQIANSFDPRFSNQTPPKSTRLLTHPTRSTPNLYSAKSNNSLTSNDSTLDTLDEVKQRLTSSNSDDNILSKPVDNVPFSKPPQWLLESPNFPASSFTSQFFPMVEEEDQSCKFTHHPLHTSQSSPLIIPSYPKLGEISSSWSSTPKINISFKNLEPRDVAPEPILPKDNAEDFDTTLVGVSENSLTSVGDVTPTNPDISNLAFVVRGDEEDVLKTVNYLLDSVSIKNDYNTCDVTDDDGLMWLGDVMEASA